MKKKITAMLLAICCISSTWTVYADDFSSGSSEVEIEITEDEDADVDDVEITEDADANDEMFSDGTESSTSGGDISAMANQIVARAEIQAQEYQQLKKEARKMHCYEVTLNVWSGNTSAEKFYEKMGMKTKERQMEYILDNL